MTSHIHVIGSGVIGLQSALALTNIGASVTVIDSGAEPAWLTSRANAGQLSFVYAGPIATPGLTMKLPKMLADAEGPVRIYPDIASPARLLEQFKFLYWSHLNTKISRFETNKRRILQLCNYSREAHERNETLGFDYNYKTGGLVQICRNQKLLDSLIKNDLQSLEECNVEFEVGDAYACIEKEPALEQLGNELKGGFIFPGDSTGDCYAYCQQLQAYLESLGVNFMWNCEVTGLEASKRGITGLRLGRDRIIANNVVLATGPHTAKLAKTVSLNVPIYPVRGYSLTAPVLRDCKAPVSTVMDERTKIAFTRLGDVLRVGGSAEISGYGAEHNISRRDFLEHTTDKVFRGAVDLSYGADRVHWSGLRPCTPDGTPVIGITPVNGLSINAGHGTLGWTQSAGSAKLLAHILAGKSTELDPSEYWLERYGRLKRAKRIFDQGHLQPTPA